MYNCVCFGISGRKSRLGKLGVDGIKTKKYIELKNRTRLLLWVGE